MNMNMNAEALAALTALRKTVVGPITDDQLPEPFKAYWTDQIPNRKHLDRPWKFYLVDGELYIEDTEVDDNEDCLLMHWTTTCCCGVQIFMRNSGISVNLEVPTFVRKNGEYLFYAVSDAENYETGIKSPIDGRYFTVHSG